MDDLFAAAATNEIVEWDIPVGDTMPFMSSRENGRPDLPARNVTWAGRDPIHGYAFTFSSDGHYWRCVTPKPCSNFFVEDLGVAPMALLALDCSVPDKVGLGHTLQICLSLHNTGNVPETNISVVLPIPATTLRDRHHGGWHRDQQVGELDHFGFAGGRRQASLHTRPESKKPGTLNSRQRRATAWHQSPVAKRNRSDGITGDSPEESRPP